MDGDIAPLAGICDVAERYEAAVMVDDAHASGVLGRNGRGTVDHFDLHGRVDIQVGTLSKAIGVMGGYIAGRQHLKDFLTQRCRTLLFSTSQPPAVAAACIAAIDVLEQEPERIERLWDNTRFFKKGLSELGFDTGISETPITPVMAGDEAKAQQLAARPVRAGHLRHVRRLPDRCAGQGARAHDRDQRALARRPAAVPRRVRHGGPRAAADLARRQASRWVCLDVGETLIDETRIWSIWARRPRRHALTFMAAFGAAVARGGEHQDVFSIVGRPDWRDLDAARHGRASAASRTQDLYPDALPAVQRAARRGLPSRDHRQPARPADRGAARIWASKPT